MIWYIEGECYLNKTFVRRAQSPASCPMSYTLLQGLFGPSSSEFPPRRVPGKGRKTLKYFQQRPGNEPAWGNTGSVFTALRSKYIQSHTSRDAAKMLIWTSFTKPIRLPGSAAGALKRHRTSCEINRIANLLNYARPTRTQIGRRGQYRPQR